MEELVEFNVLSNKAKKIACELVLEGKEPKAHKRAYWSVKSASEATIHYKSIDFGDVNPAEYLEKIKSPV